MLTTLLPPTAGRATVAGFDIATQGADVRRHIGAALQEAALDTLPDGSRAHGPAGRPQRPGARPIACVAATELLERVGLIEAAERKVGGYSGGMKRRLDLALALVHSPRSSSSTSRPRAWTPRAAARCGTRSQRLATDDGVTVFLTTQYLEEADVLADRVGIIDRGRIVAEGTPDELKAEIGGDTVEAIPARSARPRARCGGPGALRRGRCRTRPRAWPCGSAAAPSSSAEIVRALDDAGHRARAPAAALPVAGRRLPGQDRALAGGGRRGGRGRRRGGRARVTSVLDQVGLVARRSVRRTLRQPALIVPTIVFPLFLLAVNSSGLSAATNIPGFPADSYLDFAITVCFIQGAMFAAITAGTELATDVETRLPQSPAAHAADAAGDPHRADGGRDDPRAARRRDLPRRRPDRRASASRAASAARSCSSSTPCSSPSPSRASAPHRRAHGLPRGGAGRVPADVRRCSSCRR